VVPEENTLWVVLEELLSVILVGSAFVSTGVEGAEERGRDVGVSCHCGGE
jgi:hypothetical protein